MIMVVSKTCDHIQIKIKIATPSQEPPASSKAPSQDLKDMDDLCTFKIKIESQKLENGCNKIIDVFHEIMAIIDISERVIS